MRLPPADLIIDRQRENVQDGIGDLVRSIRELGQLQPVVAIERATGEYQVVAGRRRVLACDILEIDVDVRVVDNLTSAAMQLKAERDENTCRAELLPSDKAILAARLEELEAPQAAARQAAGKPSSESDGGRTDDKIAAAIGESRDTTRKLMTVARAADDPGLPPEKRAVAVAALAEMDRTGKIDPAFRKVKEALSPVRPSRLRPSVPVSAPLSLIQWDGLGPRFCAEFTAMLNVKPHEWERASRDLLSLIARTRPATADIDLVTLLVEIPKEVAG